MLRNLYYLTANRFPDYRAASVQQMRMCSGFGAVGLSVELISRRYTDPYEIGLNQDLWEYYGLDTPFRLHLLPSLQANDVKLAPWYSRLPAIGGLTASLFFALFWGKLLLLCREQMHHSVIYGREVRMIYVAQRLQEMARINIPSYFEAHRDISQIPWSYYVLSRLNGIISITQALKEHLVDTYDLDPARILVEPDAVDIEPFEIKDDAVDATRRSLNLPSRPTRLVGFSGNLYPGRGGEQLIRAFAHIVGDTHLVVVGGQPNDLNRVANTAQEIGVADRITFVGHVAPANVPLYVRVCDVLVAPYTSQIDTASYTSPMKIFEYMAARRPMIVSRLPVLEEVLRDGRNCLFVPPGDVDALVSGIQKVLDAPELAQRLADVAYQDVQRYTWQARAKRIKEFIQSTADVKIQQ